MLGPAKSRCLDRPVLVSLETVVPQDHFCRHLDTALDLSFVREWVADRYAPIGRPSIDPVVFFKLQLIMFFEGLRSERRLMEIASLNLARRWYLGYHLDEALPDHSSLTRIRQRLGLPLFRRFFEHVVELCDQAGLIWGKELFFDATKVEANASLDSVALRLYEVIEDHLVDLFGDDANTLLEPLATAPDVPDSVPLALSARYPMSERQTVSQDPGEGRWEILEQCRLDPDRPASCSYERLSNTRISRTDPDAALMRAKSGAALQLGYHDHYVVDGGKSRIILHALVTPADVMENQPMLDQLRRVIFRPPVLRCSLSGVSA